MARPALFPTNGFSMEDIFRAEGRYLEPLKTDYASANLVNSPTQMPFTNVSGLGSFQVPAGRAFYVTSAAMGGAQVYRHQASVTPFAGWGVAGVDAVTGEAGGVNFQGGGLSTPLVPGMILHEFDTVQFAATSYTDYPARAFGSIVGLDITGGTGLNLTAAKNVCTFGGSTTWKLMGDQRFNLPTYRYLTNDAGAERTFMMPDLRGWTAQPGQTDPPFAGENLWGERLVRQMLKDGKSARRVDFSFGGSNILRGWFGALQKGIINKAKIDLYLCEFGANDAILNFNDGTGATFQWSTVKRDLFKTRLALFIEHRDMFNPSAPVVFISPAIIDDNYTLNTSRTYQDSGANGQYGGVSMTRVEIARRLVEEVATSSTYGGGTANNVYYIDGLESSTVAEYVPFYINDSGSWAKQIGLRHGTYNTTNGAISYDSGFGAGVDCQDMFFKWSSNGTNEQVAAARVHLSAMHHEAHKNNIYDKISGYSWYNDF